MVQLTSVAVNKVKEILGQQSPVPAGLRVAVVGGGCSGFSYRMAFENQVNDASDNVYAVFVLVSYTVFADSPR